MVDELRDDVASTRLAVAEPRQGLGGPAVGLLAPYSPECVELDFIHFSQPGWVAHHLSAQRERLSEGGYTPHFPMSVTKLAEQRSERGYLETSCLICRVG